MLKKLFILLCAICITIGCGAKEEERHITIDNFLEKLESIGLEVGDPFEFGDEPSLKKIEYLYKGRVINVRVDDIDISVFECDTVQTAKRLEGIEQRGSQVVSGTDKVSRNNNLMFSATQEDLDSLVYQSVLSIFNKL